MDKIRQKLTSMITKLRVLNCYVKPILTYAWETW